MLPIRTKIIITYTISFGLMIAAFSFLLYQNAEKAELAKLDTLLKVHGVKVEMETEEQVEANEFPNAVIYSTLTTEGLQNVRLQLYDMSGKIVLVDSLLYQFQFSAWSNAQRNVSFSEFIDVHEIEYRCLWHPLKYYGQIQYIAQVAVPVSVLDSELAWFKKIFVLSIPVVLILTGIIAFFITKKSFQPITSMIESARWISASNLSKRLPLPKAKDEIHLLGETLNAMFERIEVAFNTQKQFVADASHEIRTPLTIIRSELEFANKIIIDELAKASISISLSEVDRLANLTQQLLLLAKLDSKQLQLRIEIVRLDELLIECVQRMDSIAAAKNIFLSLHIEDAFQLKGDREKLQSIIINLIDNAITYSSSASTIFISLKRSESNNSKVAIEVKDSGIGIAQEDLPFIFKRSFRTQEGKVHANGSGLGLAITQGFVEMHKGTIAVQSEEGKGSLFRVEFPIR